MPETVSSSSSRRRWKWYFLIVFLLSLLATGSLIVFNRSIQLTADQLAKERQRWETTRPVRYHFTYLRVENDEKAGKLYKVAVVGGKVVKAEVFDVQTRDRQGIEPPGAGTELSTAAAQGHSMDAVFDELGALLSLDARLGRRVFVRARFHPDHGAILEFVHRIMGTRERVQLSVLSFAGDGE
ncbi:MAG: hypothetical protein U0793_27960 [Gemmataceae bacterium]